MNKQKEGNATYIQHSDVVALCWEMEKSTKKNSLIDVSFGPNAEWNQYNRNYSGERRLG